MNFVKFTQKLIKNADQKCLAGFIKNLLRGGQKQMQILTPQSDYKERERLMARISEMIQQPLPTEHELKRVEIIILKYKAPEVEAECAKRLIENTDWPYKLNFYDNRPGTKNMSKIWNKLIRESVCDYLLFMDSDVFVPVLNPCWLTRLMSTFESYPDCYVVSPMVPRTSGFEQQADKPSGRPPRKATEIFAGMCVLYKKQIFDKVGYFDEDFLLYGSDVEWAHRLISSEYDAYLRPDVLVDHISRYSTQKAAKTEEEYAKIRFLEKKYSESLFKEKTGTN